MNNPQDNSEAPIQQAANNPSNMGEMIDADTTGAVGSENCGDALRMWIKFREENGRKVIDRATFQAFGCQTAIAVASVATELIRGKTPEEATSLSQNDLSAPIGPLPPMKIHCAQLVEGALKNALAPHITPQNSSANPPPTPAHAKNLLDSLTPTQQNPKIKFLRP